jgi:hypothetical protein
MGSILQEGWTPMLLWLLLIGLCTATASPLKLSKYQISLCKTGTPGLRSLADQLKVMVSTRVPCSSQHTHPYTVPATLVMIINTMVMLMLYSCAHRWRAPRPTLQWQQTYICGVHPCCRWRSPSSAQVCWLIDR